MRKTFARWTQEQIQTLRMEWHELAARSLAAKLRPHSWIGIREKACQLGLPFGVPQGYESINEAERRTGFSRRVIKKLIANHDILVHHRYPLNKNKPGVCLYVDPEEIDAAVKYRLSCETIGQAATRLGIEHTGLGKLLKAKGYKVVIGSALRLEPHIYDEIVAEYRAGLKEEHIAAGIRMRAGKRKAA